MKMMKKFSYGCGDFGCSLIALMIGMYLSFYCSVFLEIPLYVVGIMLLVVEIWDAINDIMIGNMIDRTRTKDGKARPWVKWFMIPTCITGALVFSCPESLPLPGRIAWVTISYFAFAFFYTAVNLSYSAMLSLITLDSEERGAYSSARYVGSYAGQILLYSAALPLIRLIGGDDGRAKGYSIVMILFCIIAFVMFIILYKFCPEVDCGTNFPVKPGEKQEELPKAGIKEFGANLKSLFLNGPWVLVLLIGVFYCIRCPFYIGTMNYYYRFVLGIDETFSSLPNLLGIIAGLIVLPFVPKIIDKWGHRTPLLLSFAGCAIAFLVGLLFRNNVYVLCGAITVDLALEAMQLTITFAMLADTLDYGYLKFGKKMSGLGFAASSFVQKAGPAFAGFLMSIFMEMSKLDASAEIGAPQPSSAIVTLQVMFWVVPIILSFVCVLLTKKYPIDKQESARIAEELKNRQN